MASDRQIAANRLNARRSTGPRTVSGKLRSRRNAVRHGLTAETVIGVLEDPEDYRAFEKSILADYPPRSMLEHELLVRMASLLWRLRRATAIEAGLLQIQGQILQDRKRWVSQLDQSQAIRSMFVAQGAVSHDNPISVEQLKESISDLPTKQSAERTEAGQQDRNQDIARCFLRLANLDGELLERLGRYETRLWRQFARTLWSLNSLRR